MRALMPRTDRRQSSIAGPLSSLRLAIVLRTSRPVMDGEADPFRLTAGLRRYDAFRTAAVGVGQEARSVRSTC